MSNLVFHSEEQIAIISGQQVGNLFGSKGSGSNWTMENRPKIYYVVGLHNGGRGLTFYEMIQGYSK